MIYLVAKHQPELAGKTLEEAAIVNMLIGAT
jgi:hypothetical protein